MNSKVQTFFTGVASLFNLGGVTPSLYGEQMKPLRSGIHREYYIDDERVTQAEFYYNSISYDVDMELYRENGVRILISKIYTESFHKK